MLEGLNYSNKISVQGLDWRGERKMRDYRQSPSFWTNALLSQRKTLIGSSMAICQHLSKTRQPLSTLDIIIISVNMTDKLQACLEKIRNVTSLKPEQTQAVEALLAGKDVLAILPTGFGKGWFIKSLVWRKHLRTRSSWLFHHSTALWKSRQKKWTALVFHRFTWNLTLRIVYTIFRTDIFEWFSLQLKTVYPRTSRRSWKEQKPIRNYTFLWLLSTNATRLRHGKYVVLNLFLRVRLTDITLIQYQCTLHSNFIYRFACHNFF